MSTAAPQTPGEAITSPGADRREAATSFGLAFKACMGAVRRLRGRETRVHGGISDAQYGLLFGLRDHAEMATSELACLAGLSPASATQMLEGLAADGLVSRVRSEKDRRVVLTSLTDRGAALVAERYARIGPMWDGALSGFSDQELATAAAVLDSVRTMFDSLGPSETGEPQGAATT